MGIGNFWKPLGLAGALVFTGSGPGPRVRAQTQAENTEASPIFPEDRHRELLEQLDYEPPEREEIEEEAPFKDFFDFADFNFEISLDPGTAIFVLLLLLVPLGLLIYKILGIIDTRRRNREALNRAPVGVDLSEIEEEVLVARGVEKSMLERAEDARQYDVAVRLLYIQLLKELNDGGRIRYRKDYSNRDYQRQLTDDGILPGFRSVTADYERYWYGKYRIDKLTYRGVKLRFVEVQGTLRLPDPEMEFDE